MVESSTEMMFNSKFFHNLSVSPEVTALVLNAAQRVATQARATAPSATGQYRESITVVLKHQKRSVALVVATDPKSILIESKTGNLARALRAVGRNKG